MDTDKNNSGRVIKCCANCAYIDEDRRGFYGGHCKKTNSRKEYHWLCDVHTFDVKAAAEEHNAESSSETER